ncbi:MAG: hypothetical protein ACLFVW_03300 [Phycisphaerae bacterium]
MKSIWDFRRGVVIAGLVLLSLGLPVSAQSDQESDESDDAEKTAAEIYAEKQARMAAEAAERYEEIRDAYMSSQFDEFQEAMRGSGKYFRYWEPQQRRNVSHMRKSIQDFRPAWWDNCKSLERTSFRARIWNRELTANYVPSQHLGAQMPVAVHRGKLLIVVTWRPSMVDNPRPLKGELAESHDLRRGDLGEFIVWHELGHNYISEFLPLREVFLLYRDHRMLFSILQEIYADLTGIYHSSPRGRLSGLLFRLGDLDADDQLQEHSRAAFVIGSLLLSHMLTNLDEYPSVHLPPEVPAVQVERKTIQYVYENIDPDWTVEEDRKLREFVQQFIRRQGERMLRRKGTIDLPNRLTLKVMEPEDREFQKQRDEWVAQQIKEAIEAGRADEPVEAEDEDEDGSGDGRVKPRLELPW